MLNFNEIPEPNSKRWLSLEDLPSEEWRDVLGTGGAYQISNYGRLKSVERVRPNHYSNKIWKERIRKVTKDKKGYLRCSLTVHCKRVGTSSIARMVALAFIPNLEGKEQIDHVNTIRTDNRVTNLRWATNMENAHNPITAQRVHEINSRVGVHTKSEETRKVLSEQKKGEKNPMFGKCGALSHRSKPIIQLTLDGLFVKEWPCAREANKEFKGHIQECARGERETASGYKWVYKENYKYA